MKNKVEDLKELMVLKKLIDLDKLTSFYQGIKDKLDSKQDTLTAGTSVTINASNVISATDTTYGLATASDNGLMPSTDKVKMDNIEVSGIRVYASTDIIPTLPNGVIALIYEV